MIAAVVIGGKDNKHNVPVIAAVVIGGKDNKHNVPVKNRYVEGVRTTSTMCP